MNNPIKHFSLALASLVALGLIGCGSAGSKGLMVGPNTDPVVTPPSNQPLPEPKVQYDFFRPKTEEELMGTYASPDSEYFGRPIANYGYMIAKTVAGFDPAVFDMHGVDVVASFPANGGRYFYLHKDSDLVETMKKVNSLGGVMYIEPEIMNYTTAGFVYDNPDPYVADLKQYGALTTHTKKAWETYGFGPNRPTVVDIDTGVRWTHQDFKDGSRNVVKHAFSWYNSAGAALATDIGALNALNDINPPDRMLDASPAAWGTDGTTNGHGTHTAGTIAAVGNNGKGVAGMCWNVDLVTYKGLSNSGSGGSFAVYGSLWHLARWKKSNYNHTIPVNYSLGSATLGQFQADMVEMALEHDIVMCCSSGNDQSGFSTFPGSIAGTIRVGAVNFMDRRCRFSNFGNDLSVMAPGMDILSLKGGNDGDDAGYVWMDGTSMAAPHVTSLVGYMLTFAPDLKPDQIKTYLESNTDPIEGQQGFNKLYGYGRINTYKTIGAVIADMNADRTPASDYVLTPVKVTVKSAEGRPINDATVYLYNCSQSGEISNYTGVSITGPSYVDARDVNKEDVVLENGVARFNLLRPGYYKVTANFSYPDLAENKVVNLTAASSVFQVRAGGTVDPVALTLDTGQLLYVQTLQTANATRGNTATSLQVFDHVSNDAIITMSGDFFWTLAFKPKPGATYWVRVYPFSNAYYGEYALWVGTATKQVATGTRATPGPDGIASTNALARPNAQEIQMDDKFVYGDLTNTIGHNYKFTVPAPPPEP